MHAIEVQAFCGEFHDIIRCHSTTDPAAVSTQNIDDQTGAGLASRGGGSPTVATVAIRSAMEKDRKPQGMREAPATFVAANDQRLEVLAGLVERVTFHSTETDFCVLRVKAREHRDLVTTVGHSAMISAGEWITASGIRLNDRNHGLPFKAHFLMT